MNYIIFGGTGFIGTHLSRELKQNNPEAEVWNFDIVDPEVLKNLDEKQTEEYTTIKNRKTALKKGEKRVAKYVKCDIRTKISTPPFTPTKDDIIIHLAAVHRTPGHPDEAYFETNMTGAENVRAFAEQYEIKTIIFLSSIAPYGTSESKKEEDTLPMPNTPYGISKLVAEKTLTAWQQSDNSRRLTILRPGVVFGKGENGNFTRMYWGIRKHTFAYPGRKDTVKACVYVKELTGFIQWCIADDTPYKLYNCTYEPAYTIEHIVEEMKKQCGLTQMVPYIPNWIIMPAAYIMEIIGSPMGICPERVKKLQISTNISGKKMLESGYMQQWPLDKAIKDWDEDCNNKGLE